MRSQYPFVKKMLSLALLPCLVPLAAGAQPFPGGFVENPATAVARRLPTVADIAAVVPPIGKFTFPSPYNTEAVRLTNDDNCNGLDCVNYIGYSYWSNMNNHIGQDTMLIFVATDKTLGGKGPSLLQYNKITDEVQDLGALFDDASAHSYATGEGWYFSGTRPTALYIPDLSSLLRYDVITETMETVVSASVFGPGKYLWQAHSSANDLVHSVSVRAEGSEEMLGCGVYKEATGEHLFFPKLGEFDECQVDKSGDWLLIKEDVDGKDGEDNRIINLVTGNERILLDRDGAAGHSDMGYGYMIAADNFALEANTQKLWDFTQPTLEGKVVYNNSDWTSEAPAHVSHNNARPDMPASQQFACGSSANRENNAEANEIVCFGLNGSTQAMVIAPTMTNLDASGGGNDYAKAPKGNVDITGKYFIWSSNIGGSRLDLFLAKLPDQLAGGPEVPRQAVSLAAAPVLPPVAEAQPVLTPEAPLPAPGAAEYVDGWLQAPTQWSDLVNVEANGGSLVKTRGCDGCPDTRAKSMQVLQSGNGYLEFTITDPTAMQIVGVSRQHDGTSPDQIDFALSLQGGYAEVRENGAYLADTILETGDVFRIALEGGTMSYARNGQVFYTSSATPAYPLQAVASLLTSGSGISNAVVAGQPGSGAPAL